MEELVKRKRKFICAPGYVCIASPETPTDTNYLLKGEVLAISPINITENGAMIKCPVKVGKQCYFVIGSGTDAFRRFGRQLYVVHYDNLRGYIS